MPTIDVTDVILDPDFVEPFTVQRRHESINNYGRAIFTVDEVTAYGVVQPNTDKVERSEDGQRSYPAVIDVYTTYRLYGSADGRSPDVVFWSGRAYIVMNVRNWTKWGPGFVAAECHALDLQDST